MSEPAKKPAARRRQWIVTLSCGVRVNLAKLNVVADGDVHPYRFVENKK